MSTGGPETPGTAVRIRQFRGLDERRMLDALDDQLRDPVAPLDLDRHLLVVVDEQDGDLAAVPGVDRPGSVDHGQAVPDGQSGSRVHERGMTFRQRDRDSRRDHRPLTRCQREVDPAAQVGAGVARLRIRREGHLGIEARNENVNHGVTVVRRVAGWCGD
jgi:hypothetical protein